MKRRRRLFNAIAIQFMQQHAYGGDVIPPGSIVVAKQEMADKYGKEQLKVEYYSKVFGLNEVFLVDSNGEQKAWLTQKEFRKQFDVVTLADEWDDFQSQRPPEERAWKGPGSRGYLGRPH